MFGEKLLQYKITKSRDSFKIVVPSSLTQNFYNFEL